MDYEEQVFLVIGSDNFWYGCNWTLEEAYQVINSAREDITRFGHPDHSYENRSEIPREFKIFKAQLVEIIPGRDEDDEE